MLHNLVAKAFSPSLDLDAYRIGIEGQMIGDLGHRPIGLGVEPCLIRDLGTVGLAQTVIAGVALVRAIAGVVGAGVCCSVISVPSFLPRDTAASCVCLPAVNGLHTRVAAHRPYH